MMGGHGCYIALGCPGQLCFCRGYRSQALSGTRARLSHDQSVGNMMVTGCFRVIRNSQKQKNKRVRVYAPFKTLDIFIAVTPDPITIRLSKGQT